jgi:hypothetical protein
LLIKVIIIIILTIYLQWTANENKNKLKRNMEPLLPPPLLWWCSYCPCHCNGNNSGGGGGAVSIAIVVMMVSSLVLHCYSSDGVFTGPLLLW